MANHLHNLDPLVVAVAIPRPVHYMGKVELFRVPILGPIIRFGGTFPVERGRADRRAIRQAEETLRQGIAFGIFPEGTRSPTATMTKPLAGAALIALRSGAPVLPVGVTGTEHLPLNGSKAPKRRYRRAARVTIGKPFTIPRVIEGERLTSEGATDVMMRRVAELVPAGYRGVYVDADKSAHLLDLIALSLLSRSLKAGAREPCTSSLFPPGARTTILSHQRQRHDQD